MFETPETPEPGPEPEAPENGGSGDDAPEAPEPSSEPEAPAS
jgi:hypothetical protein